MAGTTAPTPTRPLSRLVRRAFSRAALAGAVLAGAVLLAATAGTVLPAVAGPVSAVAAGSARIQPGVTCGYSPPVVAPTFVPVSCGDGSAFVIHVRWTYLSVTTGRAKGIFMLDDCAPNCAYGHYRTYAARLTFTRVRLSAGHPYFTRVLIVFTTRRPNGRAFDTASY